MDTNTIAYLNVMFYDGVAANAHVVADFIQLSYHDRMPGLKVGADAITRVNHRVRAYDCIRADASLQITGLHVPRRHTDNNILANAIPCAQIDFGVSDVGEIHLRYLWGAVRQIGDHSSQSSKTRTPLSNLSGESL